MGQKAKKIRKYISIGGIFLLLGNFLAPFVSLGSLGGVQKAKADFSDTSPFSMAMQNFYTISNTATKKYLSDYTTTGNIVAESSYVNVAKGDCDNLYAVIYTNVGNVDLWWKDNYLPDLAKIYDPNSSIQYVNKELTQSTADAIKIKENLYLVWFGLHRWSHECTSDSRNATINLDTTNNMRIGAPDSWPAALTTGSVISYTNCYKSIDDFWTVFSSLDTQVQALRDAQTANNGQLPSTYNIAAARVTLIKDAINPDNANQSNVTTNNYHDACGTSGYGWQIVRQMTYMLCGVVVIATNLTNDFLYTTALALNENAGPIIPNIASSGTISNGKIENVDGSQVSPIIDLGPMLGTSAPVETQLVNAGTSGFGSLVIAAYNGILRAIDFLLLVIFLLVALANILQIDVNTYSLKKILPGIIIGFICAQFSMFGIRSLLEITSALTRGIINSVVSSSTNVGDNFVSAFEGFPFGNNSLYQCGKPDSAAVVDSSLSVFTDSCLPGGDVSILKLLKQILSNIFVFVGAIFIGILAFYFLLREYVFFALVPLAPIAFLGLFFPPLKVVWSRWWKFLSGWLFMPLVAGFWLAMSILWFKATGSSTGAASLLGYVFGVVALYLAIKTPFSMAGEAGAILNKMNSTGGAPFKAAGKYVGDEAKRKVTLSKLGDMGRTVQGWRDNRKTDLDAAKAGVDLRAAKKAAKLEKNKQEFEAKAEVDKNRLEALRAKGVGPAGEFKVTNIPEAERAEYFALSKTVKQSDRQANRMQRSFNKTNRGNEARARSKIVREKDKQVFGGGSEYVHNYALAQLYDPNNESRQASHLRNSDNLQRSIEDTNKELMSRADSNGKTFFATAEDVMSKDESADLKNLEAAKANNDEIDEERLQFLQHKQAQASQVARLRAGRIGNIKINAAVTNKVQSNQENAGVRSFLLSDFQKYSQSTDMFEKQQAIRNAREFENTIRDDVKIYDPETEYRKVNDQITSKLKTGIGKLSFGSTSEEELAAADLSKITAIYNGIMDHSSKDPAYINTVVDNLAAVLNVKRDELNGIDNLKNDSDEKTISIAKQDFVKSTLGKNIKWMISNAGSFYGGNKIP